MATGNSNSSSSGIGFLGLLGIVFITLKLMHYIDWSWWWVTAPLWGGFVIALAILAIFGLVVGIDAVVRRYRKWVRS